MRFPWNKKNARYVVDAVTLTGGVNGTQVLEVSKLTYDDHTFRSGDVIEVKGHFGSRVGGSPKLATGGRVRMGDPLEGED